MKASRNIGIPIGMPGMHQDHECILRPQVRDSLGGRILQKVSTLATSNYRSCSTLSAPSRNANRHSFGIAGGARNPEPIADWIQRSSAKPQGEDPPSSFVPYSPEAKVWWGPHIRGSRLSRLPHHAPGSPPHNKSVNRSITSDTTPRSRVAWPIGLGWRQGCAGRAMRTSQPS